MKAMSSSGTFQQTELMLAITRINTIVFKYVKSSGVNIKSYIRLQSADATVITPITAPPIPLCCVNLL